MKTLLIITPAEGRNCVFNLVVAKTGEGLGSHFCSNEAFAYGDLVTRREKDYAKWFKRFGELEVKYIDDTDLTDEILIARNKEWFEVYNTYPEKMHGNKKT